MLKATPPIIVFLTSIVTGDKASPCIPHITDRISTLAHKIWYLHHVTISLSLLYHFSYLISMLGFVQVKKKNPLRFITLPLPIMYEPVRTENIPDSSLCLTEPEQHCLVHCWCSVLFHWKQEVLPCSLTTFPWLYTFIKDLRPHWYFTLIFIHLTNVHWVPAWS